MPLPSTGLITLSAVANEFRQPLNAVDLDEYVRGGKHVKNIPKNIHVPRIPPIGLNDLHSARFYSMRASFNAVNEDIAFTSADGSVSVDLSGSSNDYTIRLGQNTTKVLTNGITHFNNLSTGLYDLTITDDENLMSYGFKVTIGCNKLAADLVFNLNNNVVLLNWNSNQSQGSGYGPSQIDIRPYSSVPYPASVNLKIGINRTDATVNGAFVGESKVNSFKYFNTTATLTDGQFSFEAKDRGWGQQAAQITANIPKRILISAEQNVVQAFTWVAVIDGSDYFTFKDNTLTITHRNFRLPTHTTITYRTWVKDTGETLEQGTFVTPPMIGPVGKFTLPFSILKTTDIKTSAYGRHSAKFLTLPSPSNNYTIVALANDDPPSEAAIYSFSVVLTRSAFPNNTSKTSYITDLKGLPYALGPTHILG